jgi:hypothetical protein
VSDQTGIGGSCAESDETPLSFVANRRYRPEQNFVLGVKMRANG